MPVTAFKIFGPPDTTVIREWNCGTFDAMQDYQPGNGWVEISRNCDIWVPTRRTLYPYASGNIGGGATTPPIPSLLTFEKSFIATEGEILLEFDFSDINGGLLPANLNGFNLYQNGKWIPKRALTADYSASTVTLSSEWGVEGANYDAVYQATPYTP